ncbi:hypothetical protein [Nitrosopumilus sp.]|uniref:hypothetical protein n=1 Tax=Nitrosopumilus sp. TaxID=2024843 RepID=UPI003D107658
MKRIVSFDYHGHHRIAEPHVFGIKDGRESLLVYQIAGTSSSGGIPEWRRMFVNDITNFQITEQSFPGKRYTQSGEHSNFDRIIKIVD